MSGNIGNGVGNGVGNSVGNMQNGWSDGINAPHVANVANNSKDFVLLVVGSWWG